jgi:hypothetical protein
MQMTTAVCFGVVGVMGVAGVVGVACVQTAKHLANTSLVWQTNKEPLSCTTYTLRAQSQLLGLKWHNDIASYRLRVRFPDDKQPYQKEHHYAEVAYHEVHALPSCSTYSGVFGKMLTHMQAQAKAEAVRDLYCPAYSVAQRVIMKMHSFAMDHQNDQLVDIMHKAIYVEQV